jgi:hypothetical protein
MYNTTLQCVVRLAFSLVLSQTLGDDPLRLSFL